MTSNVKMIKQISTKTYDIALIELPGGKYCVFYGHPNDSSDQYTSSEEVSDYKMASFLFGIKLQELEGH